MIKDRFTLEEKIMECWNVTSDLDTLMHAIDDEASEDDILNIIIGMKALYNQKFNTLFQTLTELIQNGIVK